VHDQINPQDEADRIARIFQGLDQHIETVAVEYASAIGRTGKALENELVKRGYDRPWLHCLEDIAAGKCDPCVLRLDPTKRAIVMTATPARQREIVRDGIGGKPIDRIAPDVLRHELQGKPARLSKKRRDMIPVAAHLRNKAGRPDDEHGVPSRVRVGGMSLRWHDIVTAVVKAAEEQQIPEEEILRLLRALEVLRDSRQPLEV
jgi:hypothetical protein